MKPLKALILMLMLMPFPSYVLGQAIVSVSNEPVAEAHSGDTSVATGPIVFAPLPGTISVKGSILIGYGVPIISSFSEILANGTGGYAGNVAIDSAASSLAEGRLVANMLGGVATGFFEITGVKLTLLGYTGTSLVASLSPTGNAIVAGQFQITIVSSIIRDDPVITAISPESAVIGGQSFSLSVQGSNFAPQAIVRLNGNDRPTTFESSTQLSTIISSDDLLECCSLKLTVYSPPPHEAESNAISLPLVNPAPVLSSISPTQIGLRSFGAQLVANGSNFQPSSVIQGNGIDWPTQYASSGQLTAEIPTDVLATLGTVRIIIVTPSPGGGASTEKSLTVQPNAQIYFPQVSVDGGYSTAFALVNIGDATAQGQLTFLDQSGNPMTVDLAESDQSLGEGFQFPISIDPGASIFLTASAPSFSDTPATGWARIESVGGLLNGVSTFTLVVDGAVVAATGVLATEPLAAVTIPVDNDSSQNRSTAFAIANPGDTDISISLKIVDKNGRVLDIVSPAQLNPLPSQNQIAMFLYELLPSTADFRGSIQFIANGGRFIVTALVQNQSQLTAIPVIPGKSSGTQ